MVEVLPAPLGPRKPNDSPLAMLKSTPSTATKSPKRFSSPCASTMGRSDAVAAAGAGRVGAVGAPNRGRQSSARNVTSLSGNDTVPPTGADDTAGGRANGWDRTGTRRSRPGFTWGTATAAHQIEGGNANNDWWAFEHTPGSGCAEPSGDCLRLVGPLAGGRGPGGRARASTTTASRWSGAGSSRPKVSSPGPPWRTTGGSASGCASAAWTRS